MVLSRMGWQWSLTLTLASASWCESSLWLICCYIWLTQVFKSFLSKYINDIRASLCLEVGFTYTCLSLSDNFSSCCFPSKWGTPRPHLFLISLPLVRLFLTRGSWWVRQAWPCSPVVPWSWREATHGLLVSCAEISKSVASERRYPRGKQEFLWLLGSPYRLHGSPSVKPVRQEEKQVLSPPDKGGPLTHTSLLAVTLIHSHFLKSVWWSHVCWVPSAMPSPTCALA